MLYLYNLFVKTYSGAIRLAARWNKKAAAWVEGRKDVFEQLQKNLSPTDRVIWMHCSSAGEFEQGKPVLEALKNNFPSCKLVLTFFSPSGYSVATNYTGADAITFLPVDTRRNAERFFELVKPELAIFVKYEFWYHHLAVTAFHHTPILLISAAFRREQVFFKPYGRFFRQMLHLFRHIFVQDTLSMRLLQQAGIAHCSLSGDTRFDRVMKIREQTSAIPFIGEFIAGKVVIVAGSTWPGDEEVLAHYLRQKKDVKLIIAPHEIDRAHLEKIKALFPEAVFYTDLSNNRNENANLEAKQVLVVNTVGMLSRLYRYATLTYVGGGFTKDGIHNILEAAVWEKPVVFGPNYQKYREAKELIDAGGAASFETAKAFKKIADKLLLDSDHLQQTGIRAKTYIESQTGATAKILKTLQEKRLLTN